MGMVNRNETVLERYAEALVEARRLPAQRTREVVHELKVGLKSLARFHYAQSNALFGGEEGLEVLHDVVLSVLSGEVENAPGAVLRAVSRAGYERFRRGRTRRQGFDDRSGGLVARDDALDPDDTGLDLSCLPPGSDEAFDAELRAQLHDAQLQKKNGGIHLEQLAHRRGVTTRHMRSELNELAAALGRGPEHAQFWRARLSEAFLGLLRAELEAECEDLVPTAPERSESIQRARRALARLKFCSIDAAHKRGLRLARRTVRDGMLELPHLREASEALGAAPDELARIDAERALMRGQAGEAHAQLDALEARMHAPSARARSRELARLTRARVLAYEGRSHEAAHVLETVASLHRRDALLTYNRLVLAIRTRERHRAQQSCRDLQNIDRRESGLCPLLRRRIREALAL